MSRRSLNGASWRFNMPCIPVSKLRFMMPPPFVVERDSGFTGSSATRPESPCRVVSQRMHGNLTHPLPLPRERCPVSVIYWPH
jgi:hypothetical protein